MLTLLSPSSKVGRQDAHSAAAICPAAKCGHSVHFYHGRGSSPAVHNRQERDARLDRFRNNPQVSSTCRGRTPVPTVTLVTGLRCFAISMNFASEPKHPYSWPPKNGRSRIAGFAENSASCALPSAGYTVAYAFSQASACSFQSMKKACQGLGASVSRPLMRQSRSASPTRAMSEFRSFASGWSCSAASNSGSVVMRS